MSHSDSVTFAFGAGFRLVILNNLLTKMRTIHIRPLIGLWLIVLLATVPCMVRGQSVTIGTISASAFCSGDPISVSFTATGYWQHKNAFTLQLSDPSGSFTSGFTNLASIKDTLPGAFTINATIPGVASSTHYRFRIMAALPYTTSADNGSDIAIGQVPNLSVDFPRLQAALVDTPIGIYAYTNGSNTDTFYWNFGDGATPATAVGAYGDSVTYSTGGLKVISVREASAGGCSATVSDTIRVFDCTAPVIPHDAIVIADDTILRGDSQTFWVNPGVTVKMFGAGLDTVFAESGATIVNQEDADVFYLKPGATLQGNGYVSLVVYAEGASAENIPYSLSCPALSFDYTNAPPNAAMPAAVSTPSAPIEITLSPNPTKGIVTISGMPTNARNISLDNVLGAHVGAWPSSGSPSLTLDLSTYTPGTYYLRFLSGMTVVTRKIVVE